jgi:hypothetical protein
VYNKALKQLTTLYDTLKASPGKAIGLTLLFGATGFFFYRQFSERKRK